MLVTVSTVKDTLEGVQRWVSGSLAGGVDHLVVMLDAPGDADQAEPRAWLERHPHVTVVATDDEWWQGDRPPLLNVRQRINANLFKHVLAGAATGGEALAGQVDWLFHVDGDEVVQVNPAALALVPDAIDAVRLEVLETVSRPSWEGADPTWFKRLLDEDDLVLLHTLGVIDDDTNGAYFHGHAVGKSGVRPGATGWFTLHRVVDEHREPLEEFCHPDLRMLHYESWSGEEFVRKWTAMLASGPAASFRPARGETAAALRTLVTKDLDEATLADYLRRIFERTTADDFETLRDLDLLEQLDPAAGSHRPQVFGAAARAALDATLAEARSWPKRPFHNAETAREMVREEGVRAGRRSWRRR